MNQVTYVIYAIIVVVVATVISHSPTRDRSWGSSGSSYFSSGSSYGGGSYGGGSFHK